MSIEIMHHISNWLGRRSKANDQGFVCESYTSGGMDISANCQIDDIKADSEFIEIFKKCQPFTMTSVERAYALYMGCKYIISYNIEGDFVECGVWKGGSAMIMAYTLLSLNVKNRKIYLYDTFEGMSKPGDVDEDINHQTAKVLLDTNDRKTSPVWCYATEAEVKDNLLSTGYMEENLFFIKGKVEETIPNIIPEKIALLRLDTDWYASTYHEMANLYPCLMKSGVLIIDDYGHWMGAKKAVDDYFNGCIDMIFLHRIDYTGRLLIKQ